MSEFENTRCTADGGSLPPLEQTCTAFMLSQFIPYGLKQQQQQEFKMKGCIYGEGRPNHMIEPFNRQIPTRSRTDLCFISISSLLQACTTYKRDKRNYTKKPPDTPVHISTVLFMWRLSAPAFNWGAP